MDLDVTIRTKKVREVSHPWITYKWPEKYGDDLIDVFFSGNLTGIIITVESVDKENNYIL